MKSHQRLRHAAATVASLGLFMVGSVLASASALPISRERPSGSVLIDQIPDDVVQSPSPRLNDRTIKIAGSSREVHLWDQAAADGVIRPHYAIMERSQDGGAAALVGRERETSYDVSLRYALFDPLRATPGVNAELFAPANNEIFLVQFWAVPLDEMRDQIEAMGGTIHRYLKDHTHIVQMPAGVAQNVGALNYVRWVGPFHAAYKLDSQIVSAFARGFPEDGVEGAQDGLGEWMTKGEYSIEVFERGMASQTRVKNFINAIGGSVSVTSSDGFRMQANLTPAQLIRVAKLNEVHFIDPWGMGGGDMNIARLLGGANYLETQTGATGEGVRAEVYDSELRTTHQEFAGVNNLILHGGVNATIPHGTSVFSILFAQGVSGNARGLLPDAERSYFYHALNSTQHGGAQTRRTIADETVANQVVVQTSSIGNPTTLAYGTISAEMDDVVFQTQLLHTQSQSNTGNQFSRPQAWAKNIVSGGAVTHQNTSARGDDTFLNSVGQGTSTGPAADGRIKPDLSFFFDDTWAASNSGNSTYTQFGGTSGATPTIGGYMGLFHQLWHENTWAGSGMLPSGNGTVFSNRPNVMLPKVALINSAFRYNWNSGGSTASLTRFIQGWGMPNLQTLHGLRDKTYYVDEPFLLGQGDTKTHYINVAAGEPNLNISMAYLDPMGTTSAAIHRINDVTLRVTSPSGTSFWGNNGLAADNFSTSGGSSNTVDTVENVFIPNPQAGQWMVEVMADVVVQDAHVETAATDVDYAMWITGGKESGSLKTTFKGGNGHDGVMFDFTAHEDIEITGFDVAHVGTSIINMEVYWAPNTYVGKETNPAAWTLFGSDSVTPLGDGAAAHVNVGGLKIYAGQTVGLYVTDVGVATGNMTYTNGTETWANGEVTINAGIGKAYPFAASFTPRSFNGVVYYKPLVAEGQCIETLFAANNGGDVGGAAYFDASIGSTSILVSGLNVNTAKAVGEPINADIYITPTTSVGKETSAGLWTKVSTGSGLSAGTDEPSRIALEDWFTLDANTSYGVAVVLLDGEHRYTNGTITNRKYVDGNITLTLGKTSNVPFTAPTFSPRIFNGGLCYSLEPLCTDVVFDQSPPNPSLQSRNSNTNGGGITDQQIADDFEVKESASIESMTLWAVYTGTGVPAINQSLVINIYADQAGLPGALLYSEKIIVTPELAGPVQTGLNTPRDLYQYSVNLPVPFAAQSGQTYWLSALGNTVDKEWSWQFYSTSGTRASRSSAAASWSSFSSNLAFRLCGQTQSCPCACNFDTSTGNNVCDIFDFLAFQNSFVGGDLCACDIDTSTGKGVCDIFDFLAFQNAFVGGCK